MGKYLGKRTIINLEEYEKRREEINSIKSGAVFTLFAEMEDLISKSALARQYFHKTASWLSQRVNGCVVRNTKASFKEHEYHQLAEALRDIAKRLNAHADEIDEASMDCSEDYE